MYDEIRDELKEKQEELFSWKAQLEMSLAEAPKGKLYRSASNGYEQYYIREPDHNGRIRKKYVRKNERKQLAKIWQRDYDCKILSMIKKRIQCIDQFLEQFSACCPEEVYEKLPLEQKKTVSPFVLTDEMYIKEWESVFLKAWIWRAIRRKSLQNEESKYDLNQKKSSQTVYIAMGYPTDMNILFICVEWELSTRILSACM